MNSSQMFKNITPNYLLLFNGWVWCWYKQMMRLLRGVNLTRMFGCIMYLMMVDTYITSFIFFFAKKKKPILSWLVIYLKLLKFFRWSFAWPNLSIIWTILTSMTRATLSYQEREERFLQASNTLQNSATSPL